MKGSTAGADDGHSASIRTVLEILKFSTGESSGENKKKKTKKSKTEFHRVERIKITAKASDRATMCGLEWCDENSPFKMRFIKLTRFGIISRVCAMIMVVAKESLTM